MRREEAFLLFAIALESIILADVSAELSYRLRTRTARLLGRSVDERAQISDEVNKLYLIRSKIVHDGYYQITEDQRLRIRHLVKRVVFAILSSRAVAGLRSKEELGRWFERKVLS